MQQGWFVAMVTLGRNRERHALSIPYKGGGLNFPKPSLAGGGGEFDRACRIGDGRCSRMLGRKASDAHVNIEAESEV